MQFARVSSLTVGLLAVFAAASGPTKVYIDSVQEYDLLQSCAEHQVSLVVRNMAYGCGDGSKLTSYACFCFQSSAYYSRMISTKVTSACSKTRGQESSALEVFNKYCHLMDLEKVTTTDSAPSEPTSASSTQSTFASPASIPATTTALSTASPTGTPTSRTSQTPEKKDNTAAIAAGVTVPVVVVALGLVGLLFYLHRRKRGFHTPGELPASAENQAIEVSGAPMAYEKETYSHVELDAARPHELDTGVGRGELGASTAEQDRDRKIERLLTNERP